MAGTTKISALPTANTLGLNDLLHIVQDGVNKQANASMLSGITHDSSYVWTGVGVPSASLGSDGDYYIDTGTDYLYGAKESGTWPAGQPMVASAGSTANLSTTEPVSPANGELWFDSGDEQFMTYDGTVWWPAINALAETSASATAFTASFPVTTKSASNFFILYSINQKNDGACTLALGGGAAASIKKVDGTGALADPADGDLAPNRPALMVYDGTQFVLLNPTPSDQFSIHTRSTSFTAAASDGKRQLNDVTAAITATIPTAADGGFSIGDEIAFVLGSGGGLTLSTTGLTVRIPSNKSASPKSEDSVMSVVYKANDVIIVYGDLANA